MAVNKANVTTSSAFFIDNENIRVRTNVTMGKHMRIQYEALVEDFNKRTKSTQAVQTYLYDKKSRVERSVRRALAWYEKRGATIRVAADHKNAADQLMYNDIASHCVQRQGPCNIAIVTNDGGCIDGDCRRKDRPERNFIDLVRVLITRNPEIKVVHYHVAAMNVLPHRKWFHLIPQGVVSVNVFSVDGFLAPKAKPDVGTW